MTSASRDFLPASAREMKARGWNAVDVVLVTGDAYVDHPAFGTALVGRLLESMNLRVGVLAQPDWRAPEAFRVFGPPRLFFGVTAGNLDSRLASRTAQKKVRNVDSYSPGGRIGLRPDLPSVVYTAAIRKACPGVPVVLGGIEASLRRFAHYDYWSDTIRGPILLDAKADLLIYGMAERPLMELVQGLGSGRSFGELRNLRGTAVALGKRDIPGGFPEGARELPGLEEVRQAPRAFAEMTREILRNQRFRSAVPLVQQAGSRAVVVHPPSQPLAPQELDRVYELPFTRKAHPMYTDPVPALETVKDSLTILRGCFGGCSFCSLSLHQGADIQSRSPESVLREALSLTSRPEFKGTITDLGGPTANMYGWECGNPGTLARCRRTSCLHPRPCPNLRSGNAALLALLEGVRKLPAVRHVFINSGIRMDLALREPEYIEVLARYHVGGLLSVAPEHVVDGVLRNMGKPGFSVFQRFARAFEEASRRAGKRQHLSLYLIAGHPGETMEDARRAAGILRKEGLRPRQVQEFIPLPLTPSTCMYVTGLHPRGGAEVSTTRKLSETRKKKELLMWWMKSREKGAEGKGRSTPRGKRSQGSSGC